MDFVEAPPGKYRGFILDPLGTAWKSCVVNEKNCPTAAALHIGIDESSRKRFKLSKIRRSNQYHNFPTVDTCITIRGYPTCRSTAFDTGSQFIRIPALAWQGTEKSLPAGESVSVVGAHVGSWKFVTRSKWDVLFSPELDFNVVGISYFETNSFLIDIENQEIGFRIEP